MINQEIWQNQSPLNNMFSLEHLNKSQKAAVLKNEGPLMILAGAGSGKTRTLVSKISHLISEMKISPYKILALTFSNKAAKEMRERVARDVSLEVGTLRITTFHSFCSRVLRSEFKYLGLSKNFTIYDDSESKAIVKSLIKKRGLTTKELSPFEVLYFISDIQNNGQYLNREKINNNSILDEYEYEIDEDDDFFSYYQEYISELRRSNAVDFGGLITGVLELFEKHPKVLEFYQNQFKYILIDEYQDTNRAQFALIQMLCVKHKNICVVGDEDQSIYSWRGADIRNILDFEKIFPEVSVIKLEQNYRSSKRIIEAASFVIAKNEMRKGKNMWTDNPDGDAVEIRECHSDKDEGEFISKEVFSLVSGGTSLNDIAIFYRTNSQSRIIEDYLRKSRISYRVVGGLKFYERKEIKDLLAYLRVVLNDQDSLALSRIINVPARGIGATSLKKIEQIAIENSMSLWEVIQAIVDNPSNYSTIRLSAKVKSSLSHFVYLINEVKLLNNNREKPKILFEKLLHDSGYWDYLKASKDYESLARMENLQELGSGITQYEDTASGPTLLGFLESITLDNAVTDEDSEIKEQNSGEVSLMTVHGSKGLEFKYVFISGSEENVFPSYRSMEEGEYALEEERRLFYVAMTRAMKKLIITFAQSRMLFGQLKFNSPSRFLSEIPSSHYTWKNYKIETDVNSPSEGWDSFEFSQEADFEDVPVSYQVRVKKSLYVKGNKIIHSIYGRGKIMDTEGHGESEKVVIKFSDGTKKKFMVKFAPLTLE